MSWYHRVATAASQRRGTVIATVIRTSGSAPRHAGAKMLIHADGSLEGTVGGGRVEYEIIQAAQSIRSSGTPKVLDFELTKSLGMCCGGKVSVFMEPLEEAPLLLIFGAGHVARALCQLATQAGFEVQVADERDELRQADALSAATRRFEMLDDPELPFAAGTYVMVTTHDHALDQKILEHALGKPHRWLGVIGSRRKSELTRQRLAGKGFEQELIDAVRCPVGLDIGAETPEEIAVSIVAALVKERRKAAP